MAITKETQIGKIDSGRKIQISSSENRYCSNKMALSYQESIRDMFYIQTQLLLMNTQRFKQYATQYGHKMLKMLMQFLANQESE